MSDGAQAPAPAAPAAPQTPQNTAPEMSDAELNAIEAQEGSQEAQPKSEAPKGKVPEAKADKAAKQEGAKKVDSNTYKIKVDGEDLELSQEDMIKYAQMGRAGQKRMAEAAQIKKEAGELIEMLRSNPEDILSDPAILGSRAEVVKFAQKILANQLEEEQKSPETREKERLEKELEQLRAERKRENEDRQKAEYERLVQQEEQKLEKEINEAIDSSGLPVSPFILKRISDVLISAAEAKKDISPKQAMNIVKREMTKDMKEFLQLSGEDTLEDLIGSDRIKALRKKQLAKVKAQATETAAPSINQQIKPVSKQDLNTQAKDSGKKIRMKDWLRGG